MRDSIELFDSLLGIIGRVCHYLKIEHTLYPVRTLNRKAFSAALDEVFIHYMPPDCMHQLALAVGLNLGAGHVVCLSDRLIPASEVCTKLSDCQ